MPRSNGELYLERRINELDAELVKLRDEQAALEGYLSKIETNELERERAFYTDKWKPLTTTVDTASMLAWVSASVSFFILIATLSLTVWMVVK